MTTTTQYGSLREKIAAETAERKARYAKFETAFAKAVAAGMAAGKAVTPRPMVVAQHANPMNDRSAVTKAWYESEGVCGFAWVSVYPANSSFARWLKKNGHTRHNGSIWVKEFGQSMARKEAYANAMAQVLREELGVSAYAESRID